MTAPIDHVVPGRLPGRARPRTRPCGSCARPGARCPSTGPVRGEGIDPRRPSPTPSWPPRSPCSRCGATASTPPSSTPTSSCPWPPSASASTSPPVPGPVVAQPFRARGRPRPAAAARPRGRHALRARDRPDPRRGAHRPADRLRRRPVHGGQLPRRGRSVAHVRPRPRRSCSATRASGTPCSTGWPTWPSPRCGPRSSPARRPSSCSTAGPAQLHPADYRRYVLPH